MAKKPIKGNFTDGAKARAGVKVFDRDKEMAELKSELRAVATELNKKTEALHATMRNALQALEEGRRGDAAKILRQALPHLQRAAATKPPPGIA